MLLNNFGDPLHRTLGKHVDEPKPRVTILKYFRVKQDLVYDHSFCYSTRRVVVALLSEIMDCRTSQINKFRLLKIDAQIENRIYYSV